ncbi:Hypothetical protein NTJ_08593 [Nesidiocoris tenuis]|uniref:Uncharacterized protein n=1 Tax=Nesidiocoris tenuis TaxID=355587 RepID=A0ABN7AV04_9HEMI|nr:Hypothetical protein NTJ_08593 [Nesidiocoris tenuis]
MWQNGYDLDIDELTSRCRSLNLLIDCLRDDVFHAYLRLPPDHKLSLLKKNKQVSGIFAVLGALESQVATLMKTMAPHGRTVHTLKPLLYPRANPVVYKKTTQNVYNYHMPPCCPSPLPTYFSQKSGVRRTVESGTDPVRELDFADKALKKSVGIQPSKNAICGCKNVQSNYPIAGCCHKICEESNTRPSFLFSRDNLDHQPCNSSSNSNIFPSRSFSSLSMLLDDKISFKKSNSQMNLWKVAAKLIADRPNYE